MRAKSMSFVLPLKNSGKFFLAEKRKKRKCSEEGEKDVGRKR